LIFSSLYSHILFAFSSGYPWTFGNNKKELAKLNMTMNNFLKEIKRALNKRILYLPHAIRQMSRPDRMISPEGVRNVIEQGEIIEDYPNDQRGHSCLMCSYSIGDRPLHVICTPKGDYLAIITY
jgi:hypothetical protein